MALAQRTFLQRLSENERNALMIHIERSAGGITDGETSNRGSRVGRTDLEHARTIISRERERRQQLEAQVSSLQAKLQEQAALFEALRSERDALRQHAQRNDDRGARLASQLTSLEQENASLSAKLLASNNERSQLQTKIDEMQVRVAELQQSYITMAACDDGVERRDFIRRSKIGGLMAEMAATGVLDVDLQHMTGTQQHRQSQPKGVFSTIAALTRERDSLQQRLAELSERLSESVSREAATRGTHALRSASWKRSAVQAETRLTTVLRRVKELNEELRKRDRAARQRERYLAQLERTVITQHKSVQQLRRLLEKGFASGGAAELTQSGCRGVRAAGDSGRKPGHSTAPASPTDRGSSGRRTARPELSGDVMVRFQEASGPERDSVPLSPSRFERQQQFPQYQQPQPQQQPPPQQLPRQQQPPQQYPQPYVRTQFAVYDHQQDPSGRAVYGGRPAAWSVVGAAERGGLAPAVAERHSAGGGGPWTGRPVSPPRFGPEQPRAQSVDAAALRNGARGAWVEGDKQFEAPSSSSDATDGEDQAPGTRRSSSPPPVALHQQLGSMEASLAQLYRELEEFKGYSRLHQDFSGGVDTTVEPPDSPSSFFPPSHIPKLHYSPYLDHFDRINDTDPERDVERDAACSDGEECKQSTFTIPPSPTARQPRNPLERAMSGNSGRQKVVPGALTVDDRCSADESAGFGMASRESDDQVRQLLEPGSNTSGSSAATSSGRPHDFRESLGGSSKSSDVQPRRRSLSIAPAACGRQVPSGPCASKASSSIKHAGCNSAESVRHNQERRHYTSQEDEHQRLQEDAEDAQEVDAETDVVDCCDNKNDNSIASCTRIFGGDGGGGDSSRAVRNGSGNGDGCWNSARGEEDCGRGMTNVRDTEAVCPQQARPEGSAKGPPAPMAVTAMGDKDDAWDEGVEERPRRPLPTHMIGHLLRCAQHGHGHGHVHIIPRVGNRSGAAISTLTARGGRLGSAHRSRILRPMVAAGQQRVSAGEGAAGIRSPKAAVVLCRPGTGAGETSSYAMRSKETAAGKGWGPEAMNQPSDQSQPDRGRAAWVPAGRSSRSISPVGVVRTPRGQARSQPGSRATSPVEEGVRMAVKRVQRESNATGGQDARASPGRSLPRPVDARLADAEAPSNPGVLPTAHTRSPPRSGVASPHSFRGVQQSKERTAPLSPELLSPISTLLACIVTSPTKPTPRVEAAQQQQWQKPGPSRIYEDTYSRAEQRFHDRRPGSAYPASTESGVDDSSTSCSHNSSRAGAKRRQHDDDDADGADDRRKTRSSSNGDISSCANSRTGVVRNQGAAATATGFGNSSSSSNSNDRSFWGWRPSAGRISSAQLAVAAPHGDEGPASSRPQTRTSATLADPSPRSIVDSVGASNSKGAVGRPTLAGWLEDTAPRSSSQEATTSTTVTGPAAAAPERPSAAARDGEGDTGRASTAGSPPQQGSRKSQGSPIAEAAAVAAAALQRLRDQRMQRMQRNLNSPLHAVSSYATQRSHGQRVQPGSSGETGREDGGVVVLALRGSLQGEVIVSPASSPPPMSAIGVVPSLSSVGSSFGVSGRMGNHGPWNSGLSSGGKGTGQVTMQLEVSGTSSSGRAATAADATDGGGGSGGAPPRGLPPGQQNVSGAASDWNLRFLREGNSSGYRGAEREQRASRGSLAPRIPASSDFSYGHATSGMDTVVGGSRVAGANEGWTREEAPKNPAPVATQVAPSLQHSHPLMQLLGQASEDLQLLSDRLKPLVDARPSNGLIR